MLLVDWTDLPPQMQNDAVKHYYDALKKRTPSLVLKRCFDVLLSAALLVLFSPLFLILAAAIKLESEGPVFFRQKRITQFGREFRIFKFRSMTRNAERQGTLVTVGNDARITRVGKFIRKYRLDEISQLIDVFRGTMTFVGTRPEVPKYVAAYTPEMMATLLLPAGITSEASICFKDEEQLLSSADDADKVYITEILPRKMAYNLKSQKEFSIAGDFKIMFKTFAEVFLKR